MNRRDIDKNNTGALINLIDRKCIGFYKSLNILFCTIEKIITTNDLFRYVIDYGVFILRNPTFKKYK